MKMLFSNPSLKIPKAGIFGPKFKDFSFSTKPSNMTNLRGLISNKTIIFQNCCPKHPNQAFLVPNLTFFFYRNLQLDKFMDLHLKYRNMFSKLQPKINEIKYFCSQSYAFLLLHKTLQSHKF